MSHLIVFCLKRVPYLIDIYKDVIFDKCFA
uniref:Uncharacterized protein n=1 Tax=Rhizophora mucronata TaxID=61149 RepID=A0A2P2R352_RHIMU